MHAQDLSLLFAYNRWANARILNTCRSLPADQIHAPARLSFGSLFGTLAHILGAEYVWRERLQFGRSPSRILTAQDFASLDAMIERWQAEEQTMQEFIGSLGSEDLERWVEFQTTGGAAQGITLWKAFMQVAFHGMQFRSEAGTALSATGHSPGDLDFIYYLRETGQR